MGYIGQQTPRKVTAERYSIVATAGQTLISSVDYTVGYVDVYRNGLKQVEGVDFTADTGNTVTFLTALAVDDDVEVLAYNTFDVSNTVSPADMNAGLADKLDLTGGTLSGNLETNATIVALDGNQVQVKRPGNSAYASISMDAGEQVNFTNHWANKTFSQTRDGYLVNNNQPHWGGSVGISGGSGAGGVANQFVPWGSCTLTPGADRVTVPIAGVYMITFQTITYQDSVRKDTRLLVNGNTLNEALSENSTSGYHQRTHSISVKLQANDYVQFWSQNWYNNSSSYENWQTASIILLG